MSKSSDSPLKPSIRCRRLRGLLTFPLSFQVDDGACDHLKGSVFPSISLPSTAGDDVDPSKIPGPIILFCYPRTGSMQTHDIVIFGFLTNAVSGSPTQTVPDEWNQIPGARGCTPRK